MRNNILIIKHLTSPAPDARTETKNYGKTGKKTVDERALFRNNVKQKDLQEATYVFDLSKGEVIKNRYKHHETDSVTDEEALQHYIKEYAKEIANNVVLD